MIRILNDFLKYRKQSHGNFQENEQDSSSKKNIDVKNSKVSSNKHADALWREIP